VIALLDVNLLIAIIDPRHIAHDLASTWFDRARDTGWATCPITENGLVRIISQPRYPNALSSPAAASALLVQLCGLSGHHFWPDSFSFTDQSRVDATQVHLPARVTDTYLLALAVANRGRLATLDRKLSAAAVPGGKTALLLITS
jgi:hypothetical protein